MRLDNELLDALTAPTQERISTRNDLRRWYEENSAGCRELWIRVNRGRKEMPGVIGYVDAVEVALCFGWIDSTLKHFDDGCPFQRFSPRRKGGNWCERNIGRCRRLLESGEMTPAGLAAIPPGLLESGDAAKD